MTNEKEEPIKPKIKTTKNRKQKDGVKIEVAVIGPPAPAPTWDSTELDFRLAVSNAMQKYETMLVMSNEGYRKAQLALESQYRKAQLALDSKHRRMHIGIMSDLNELEMMLHTIYLVKDDGQDRLFYDVNNGLLGMKRVPRECGYNPSGRDIEEKIVSKPK